MTTWGLWIAGDRWSGIRHREGMREERWRQLAAEQTGILSRSQLRALGMERWVVRHKVASERWAAISPAVVATTTGSLTRLQRMWAGVLHTDGPALVGDLSAAELFGLQHWYRDDVTIVVPRGADLGAPIAGVRFVETRRDLRLMGTTLRNLPLMRLEPAILHFAGYQRSPRTAEGVLAAVVQQRLSTPAVLRRWIDRMAPLRWSQRFRRALLDINDGAQSVAEIDVRRMCEAFALRPPDRQAKRRDASDRVRFTDCEWDLADGRTIVLEVDGAFHMEVEHWEDDLARQRALTSRSRLVIRCTGRELRDEPGAVARDLRNLGVPRAA